MNGLTVLFTLQLDGENWTKEDSRIVGPPLRESLTKAIAQCGVNLMVSEIRVPGWTSAEESKLQEWHADGQAFEYLVMWASRYPTQYRDALTKRLIPVRAGEVVLVNNHQVQHRMPAFVGPDRWFYRGLVRTLTGGKYNG